MKYSVFFGILLGFVAIIGGFYLEGGAFNLLFLFPAMLIVIGGTLGAGLAGTSFGMMARIPSLFWYSIFPKKIDIDTIITQIVTFSAIARKEGILSLESRVDAIENPFFRNMVQLSIDGADSDVVKHIAESEMHFISERHEDNIQLFQKLGGYSPTMGIIGTVMGLIATLASAGDDPNVLIRHIASAFIATLWGILMANIFWLPIADKLRTLHNEEMRAYSIIYDGMHGIISGENPSVVHSRLLAFYDSDKQKKMRLRRPKKTENIKKDEEI